MLGSRYYGTLALSDPQGEKGDGTLRKRSENRFSIKTWTFSGHNDILIKRSATSLEDSKCQTNPEKRGRDLGLPGEKYQTLSPTPSGPM